MCWASKSVQLPEVLAALWADVVHQTACDPKRSKAAIQACTEKLGNGFLTLAAKIASGPSYAALETVILPSGFGADFYHATLHRCRFGFKLEATL